jgi:hypothetical protein
MYARHAAILMRVYGFRSASVQRLKPMRISIMQRWIKVIWNLFSREVKTIMDNPFELVPDANEILRKRDWNALNPKKETFKEQQERERREMQVFSAALWRMTVETL